MEKIIAKLNAFLSQFCIVCKVPCDKQMHFVCGFIIAAVLTPFIGAASLAWVALLALAKEVYDWVNKDIHTPDLMDWVATLLGGVVAVVLIG